MKTIKSISNKPGQFGHPTKPLKASEPKVVGAGRVQKNKSGKPWNYNKVID